MAISKKGGRKPSNLSRRQPKKPSPKRALTAAKTAASDSVDENLPPRIRPVIIYPFVQPRDLEGLRVLYSELEKLKGDPRYLKPITIINNQTRIRCTREDANPELRNAFATTMDEIVTTSVSYKTETWAVDTCAMWQRGLGDAYESSKKHKAIHDVFWLIPGDFNYATEAGRIAAAGMRKNSGKNFAWHISDLPWRDSSPLE